MMGLAHNKADVLNGFLGIFVRKTTFPKQNQRFLGHSWLSERTVLNSIKLRRLKLIVKVKFILLQIWSRGIPLLFL
jgi:hypothetical protein